MAQATKYYSDGRYVYERIAGGAGRRRIATFHDRDGERQAAIAARALSEAAS